MASFCHGSVIVWLLRSRARVAPTRKLLWQCEHHFDCLPTLRHVEARHHFIVVKAIPNTRKNMCEIT
jgi:hypothetical protein